MAAGRGLVVMMALLSPQWRYSAEYSLAAWLAAAMSISSFPVARLAMRPSRQMLLTARGSPRDCLWMTLIASSVNRLAVPAPVPDFDVGEVERVEEQLDLWAHERRIDLVLVALHDHGGDLEKFRAVHTEAASPGAKENPEFERNIANSHDGDYARNCQSRCASFGRAGS